MSYDLGWCSTHFSGEKLKATAHVSANELYTLRKSIDGALSVKANQFAKKLLIQILHETSIYTD
jgi:hypothetical protein